MSAIPVGAAHRENDRERANAELQGSAAHVVDIHLRWSGARVHYFSVEVDLTGFVMTSSIAAVETMNRRFSPQAPVIQLGKHAVDDPRPLFGA